MFDEMLKTCISLFVDSERVGRGDGFRTLAIIAQKARQSEHPSHCSGSRLSFF